MQGMFANKSKEPALLNILAKAETIVQTIVQTIPAIIQLNIIFRTNTGYMFRLTCCDFMRVDNV